MAFSICRTASRSPIACLTAATVGTTSLLCTLILYAQTSHRLGDDVVPLFQKIDLQLDPGESHYKGQVSIEIRVTRPTDGFRLHAEDLTVEHVKLRNGDGQIPVEFALDPGTLVVRAGDAPVTGSYILDIEFSNDFDIQASALYRVESGADSYVFTQFEPDDARQAFPCWDEPAFKIPYQRS